MRKSDKALALMVYETWLLNGATQESMPALKVRTWCNRVLKRELFPVEKKQAAQPIEPPSQPGSRWFHLSVIPRYLLKRLYMR